MHDDDRIGLEIHKAVGCEWVCDSPDPWNGTQIADNCHPSHCKRAHLQFGPHPRHELERQIITKRIGASMFP